ncbi:hypothetical protein [Ekhidna sp.]
MNKNSTKRIRDILFFSFFLMFHLSGAQDLNRREIDELNREAFEKMQFRNTVDDAYSLAKTAYYASSKHDFQKHVSMIPMAKYYIAKLKFDTAEQILIRSKEFLLKNNHEYIAAYAHTYLGIVYSRMENIALAIYNYKEAERLINQSDHYLMNHIYGGLGSTYERKGDYTKSLDYYNKKLVISQSARERIQALNGISWSYSYLKNFKKSIDFAKESLSMVNDSNLSLILKVDVYDALGHAYSTSGNLDSAIYYYDLLIETTPKEQQHHLSAFAAKKGTLYYQLGEFEKAIDNLSRALSMKSQSQFSVNQGSDYFYLSKSHAALGEINEALTNAHMSLKFARKKSNINEISNTSKLISDLLYSNGSLDSSIYYLRSSLAYRDSVFNNEKQKRFADLRVEIETLEKQKEIELLKKKQELDNAKRVYLLIIIIAMAGLSIAIILILKNQHKNKHRKQKIKQLELRQKIEKKEVELQQQTLHMINLNNSISEVEEKLQTVKQKEVVSSQDVQKVLSNITLSKSMDKEWQQLESYFCNIHPEFNSNLLSNSGKITHQERRLAVLIKLDLTNREISNLLNIEPRSVSMNKYRLKKKLGLSDSEDLTLFIQKK